MKLIILFAIIFVFVIPCSAQSNSVEPKLAGTVTPYKPTVYLEYICQDEKKIRLRMYNNTNWNISINAEKTYFPTKTPIKLQNGANVYAIPNNEEVTGLHYYIERDNLEKIRNLKIPKTEYYTNGGGWIKTQDSVIFSLPTEHLRKGLKIYVSYKYEWEITKNGLSQNEPEHRVYFRGGDFGSANTEIKSSPCQGI